MNRYEREIEEILQKIVDFPASGDASRRARPAKPSFWSRIRRRIATSSFKLTTNSIALAAIAMTVLGFALRGYAPSIAPFASMIAVALFVAIVFGGFRRRRTPRYEKRWRGQVVEFPRQKRDPWNQVIFTVVMLWRSFRRWLGGSE